MQFIKTGMVSLLWITQGKKTDGYQLEDTSAYNNADSPTFRLTKTDGTVYNVLLDGPASLCDCKGFEHRGMQTKDGKGCKHVAALSKLKEMGKI
ncbi:MAG TPA: SWIM zinc finger family protein [Gemmataceae bacterium]|jgi:hypothetical protein